ncbi:MAG TPA: DedA family protein [Polyangia bacterium]|nr:DedA family protein [Polyangia bacterium]
MYSHLASASPSTVYYSLAGVLLLCGLGLPIPEDLSLITAGWLAYEGVINVHKAFFVCLAAVLGGDTLAFLLGRFFGPRVLASRLFKRFFTPKKQMRVRAYFRKYGSKVMFVGRFLPGLRFTIYFSAGILKVKPAVFFVYDSLAALLSVPLLVYAAFYFGNSIEQVVRWAHRSEYGILVIVGAVVGLFAFKAYRKRRARQLVHAAPVKVAEPAPATPPLPRAESPVKAP